MTTAAEVARVLGEFLAGLHDTGYYPPARCPERNSTCPELHCNWLCGHDGSHGGDGTYRWCEVCQGEIYSQRPGSAITVVNRIDYYHAWCRR